MVEELVCDDGMLLRWGGGQTVRPLRIIIYLLLLGWCFMGVAIIADVFMVAIEKITSKKSRIWSEEKHRFVTVTVWNATVANLTLMALGSSAPEILINVLENFRDNFFNGPEGRVPLGPSTIVGSAAFNMFVIIAVCVFVIPDGQVRNIKDFGVYAVTAAFSIFAYVWLLIILLWRTPHVVEVWEGVLTFLFFPMLVGASWIVDKSCKDVEGTGILAAEMTKEELAELESKIRKEHGADLTEEQVTKFLQVMCGEVKSRAKYRIAATRAMVGGKKVRMPTAIVERSFTGLARLARQMTGSVGIGRKVAPIAVVPSDRKSGWGCDEGRNMTMVFSTTPANMVVIQFSEIKKAVLESVGSVTLGVRRSGDVSLACSVDYKSRDGTAKAPGDYMSVEGTLTFEPFERIQTIEVHIVDDFSYEENEEFYIDLFNETCTSEDPLTKVSLGDNQTITVVIVDDDLPGVLSFQEDELHVVEKVTDHEISIPVMRKNGGTGKVSCTYRTEDDTAIAGTDFEAVEGTLEFAHQEMESSIKIKIHPRGRYELSEHFLVILDGPIKGGAKFDPDSDGGADACILTVIVEGENVSRERVDRLMNTLQAKWQKAKVGHSNWRDQFVAAVYVNGGEDGDDDDSLPDQSPSMMDYAVHAIAVPWKVLFAFCPPTDYCGGWLTFSVALLFIGFVTALISDLANLLGCVLEICGAITAITLVAMGTSLPDTFASKTAAIQDPYADASIVNVTGSNSVNVFLGLGLPWMMSSIKWQITGRDAGWDRRYAKDEDIAVDIRQGHGAFIVKAGSLGFSVGVFTVFALVCMGIMFARRSVYGGELGGPRITKWMTAIILCTLWIVYIGLSAWKALEDGC
mmetsp:Transcript_5711/g.21645  ORF Transcript_5711/g.21645 Transcript_5711/m.21645 type:complete len:857 (-) Transcript_5711:68-2638(-)